LPLFLLGRLATRFGHAAIAASLTPTSTREVTSVALTLKIEMLAVCAVFVFVGAILLGAF
jgi:NADH:ubiquinone oxidoreductase subunit 6 (subunit J)